MKMRTLFSIALAGLMLGSCSKDVVNGDGGASWNENGTGYISLALNLPTTNGSRAASFDDGEGKEYEVKDAILVLFSGENETNAKFESAYNLGLGNWENDDATQITTSARIVQEINEIGENKGNVYALVVLNSNGVISVEDGTTQLKVNNNNFGDGLNELNNAIAGVDNGNVWRNKGFLMSNAPLRDNVGSVSDASTSTLVQIIKDNIFPTETEARQTPAASIFVERAQAKVQVNGENKNIEIKDKDGLTIRQYNYQLSGWNIDNYNTRSFLTRKFYNNWASYSNTNSVSETVYRFVDSNPVKSGLSLYRTYWGEDVNYNTDVALTNNVGKTASALIEIGESGYCFENTTDLTMAKGTNLTRVVIEAQLKKDGTAAYGTDFYTVNGDHTTMYVYDESAGLGSIQKRIKDFILSNQGVQDVIKENFIQVESLDLSVEFNDELKSGELKTEDDVNVVVNNEESWKATLQSAVDNALFTEEQDPQSFEYNIKLDLYKGGKAYYQAYIRHFNDEEANWDKEGLTEEEHLGRYGVLRNNWYVLNVNSIKSIGDSTYPPLPEGPIDEEEFYLSVDINIMPWAKREQNVDL